VDQGERVLVERCLGGDQSACTALVDQYVRLVGTVIWRSTGRDEEVADLTQETFLRVFRALPYYDGRAKLSTWIFTIAHRVTIDFLRRTGHGRTISFAAGPDSGSGVLLDTLPAPDADPETLLSAAQDGELVREALAQLPPKYRLPLVYAAIAGLDYSTIAEMLDLPLGTVKTQVFRAKRLLRAAIMERLDVTRAR
jgi:RNA polymerase sigma-70 factor (ECF subfamily)